MSISILNRGASGGLKPELTVTAPSGSAIDLLQNGIIIDTYTLGASETEHTFIVKVGTYIVRGTLGNKNESTEVVVDAVGQYSVTIDYLKYYLYNEGNEYTEISGGWTQVKWRGSSNPLVREKQTDCLYACGKATSSTGTGSFFGWSTANKINFSGFTKIKAVASFSNVRIFLAREILNSAATNNSLTEYPSIIGSELGFENGENMEITFNIGAVTETAYIQFASLASDGSTDWFKLHKVWLE